MKKWLYVIIPGIMLAIFLFFYREEMAELDARDSARASEVARQKAADAAHKKVVEDKARAEAEKRAADEAAEAARVTAEREAKWNAEGAKIQGETDKSNTDGARFAKQAEDLQAELKKLDAEKEKANRDDFELLKGVEAARVAQHNAEMEIQRMVTMIVNRADESTLTEMPPPPPPPPKK
jgi:hypothetical protein